LDPFPKLFGEEPTGFPGIGPALATQLMDRFGSLREVLRADPEMLSEIKGIGRKKAERICQLLDAEFDTDDDVKDRS